MLVYFVGEHNNLEKSISISVYSYSTNEMSIVYCIRLLSQPLHTLVEYYMDLGIESPCFFSPRLSFNLSCPFSFALSRLLGERISPKTDPLFIPSIMPINSLMPSHSCVPVDIVSPCSWQKRVGRGELLEILRGRWMWFRSSDHIF
jgi:hypothetical protein